MGEFRPTYYVWVVGALRRPTYYGSRSEVNSWEVTGEPLIK